MQRDASISIAKAVAIVLMVIGHTEYPGLLTSCLYTFHMPLFFITAGYFFGRSTASRPWEFCARRFRGLYLPMVKWSLMWLLLHNVMHHLGILNEAFGNWEGGVTHPYTLNDAVRRTVMIFTSMSGYDEFLAGAFWFFRGLLVASILFLVLFRLTDSASGGQRPQWQIAALISLGAVAFTAAHIYFGFKLTTIPAGGWRDVWGLFFFGIGVIYRRWEPLVANRWPVALACLLLICFAGTQHWSGMNNIGRYRDLWSLPLTGAAGFIMVHYASKVIARRESWLKRLLVYVGDNTLYILVFHLAAFKAVSVLKIAYYGLDWRQIGCHTVIHDHQDDLFWILYSLAGVILPLAGLEAARRLRAWFRARTASVLEARPAEELAQK